MILNKFGIGYHMDHIAFLLPPYPGTSLTKREALEIAGWIVVLADPHFAVSIKKDHEGKFAQILREIAGT